MKLIGRDFRPFSDIAIDTDDLGPGLVAVVGDNQVADYADSNAVGKTSLMQLVIWTLFGKCPGVSAAGKLIRRGTARGTKAYGEIQFEAARGPIHIIRSRSKSKHTAKVKLADEGWQTWDVDVATEQIERFLGVTYQQFCDLFFFTGDFRVATKTDAPLKALLGSLVPVDVTPAAQAANADRQAARGALAYSEGLLGDFDARQDVAARKAADAAANAERWDREHAARFQQAQEAVNTASAGLVEAQTQVDAWQRVITAAGDLAGSQTRAASLRGQINMDLAARDAAQRQVGELTEVIGTEFVPGNCPSCAQPLPADKQLTAQQRHAEHQARNQQTLESLYTRISELNASISTQQTELQNLDAIIAAADTSQLTAAQNGMTEWQRVLDQRANDLRAAERARDMEQGATNPYTQLLESANQEVEDLAATRLMHEEAMPELRAAVARATYIADMVAKTGLPHFAVEQLLPTVSSYASVYLSNLSAQQMTVSFLSQTANGADKLHVAAESATGGETYSDMSDGEQRRIDVAAFLALHKLANQVLGKIPILIADELLDRSTDATAKSMMLPLLNDYAKEEGCQVLVITNDKGVVADRRQFARVLMVTKTGDGSTTRVV